MEDFEGALDYQQQALRVQEKVLGKTHSDTLTTLMSMAVAFTGVTKDLTKAEEMYRLALDGFEKSLGKDHRRTKKCAEVLARFYVVVQPDELKREVVEAYPFLLTDLMADPYITEFLGLT